VKVYHVLNDEDKIEEVPLPQYAAKLCATIDDQLEKDRRGTKYEPVFTQDTIKATFNDHISRLVNVIDKAPQEIIEERVSSIRDIERDVMGWFVGDSPLGKLDSYLDVFTIRKSARRQIRSVSTSFMRFTNWQPEFTEQEAIAFLRTRRANSSSRKTYGSILRTFFKAQGVSRDRLPFEYNRIRVADEDKPKRKTMSFDRVVDFIHYIRRSENARAGFYGSLITTWGFRPIEMGTITSENINRDNHTISVQTAKHGRIRVHHIPEPIRPYLYNYEPEPHSDLQMHREWHLVCKDAGFKPRVGYGWYGIRHALFTYLSNKSGIPAQAIDKWGGWRTGVVSGAGMSNIYNAPDISDIMEIDSQVLSRHPFIGYWNDK
jgi:integrase